MDYHMNSVSKGWLGTPLLVPPLTLLNSPWHFLSESNEYPNHYPPLVHSIPTHSPRRALGSNPDSTIEELCALTINLSFLICKMERNLVLKAQVRQEN